MEAVMRKWGNSLGLRIPGLLAKDLDLKEGSHVEIRQEDNRIVIIPVKKTDLKEMLSRVTKDNIHAETDTGTPVGNEAW
jgi:antitoxin MazE